MQNLDNINMYIYQYIYIYIEFECEGIIFDREGFAPILGTPGRQSVA